MLFSILAETLSLICGIELPTMIDMMQGEPVDFTAILWVLLDIVSIPIVYVWWNLDKWLGLPDKFTSRK